jgi:cadmium resistance protein CadD (predicted permease)
MVMEHEIAAILNTIVTGAVAFAATNIDDLLILTLLFSQAGTGIQRARIVAGQFLGFTALLGISMVGFFSGLLLPGAWIGLLGIVPVVIGVRRWIHRNDPSVRAETGAISTIGVAAVTIAAGGDNVGIYTPLFAGCTPSRLAVMLTTLYFLLAVWCIAGYAISAHPAVAAVFARRGRPLVPFVLIGLGIYLLVANGALHLLGF